MIDCYERKDLHPRPGKRKSSVRAASALGQTRRRELPYREVRFVACGGRIGDAAEQERTNRRAG
jgi:hypothetical protein